MGLNKALDNGTRYLTNLCCQIVLERCDYDTCVYLRGTELDKITYLLIYVDDMLTASKDMKGISEV